MNDERFSEIDPIRIVVPPLLDGATVGEVAHALGGLPDERLATVIARGGLWADKRRVPHDQPAAAGALVEIRTPPGGVYRDAVVTPADVLYEDDAVIALNKHPGDYVGPTPWDCLGSVQVALERFLCARDGAAPPLHLAHQLDRDTSGVLLLSKSVVANAPLHRLFAHQGVQKRYLALCVGVVAQEAWEVATGLGRGEGGGFYVYPLDAVGERAGFPPVRYAHTSFRLLARLDNASLVEACPTTGRTHQIRLHLAHTGHPLLGDARYGGPMLHEGQIVPHHMLHAAELVLAHPVGGQVLHLQADLPPTWHALRDALSQR
jgi:23S rRNA pseudouridine1911/1915/1917 synthase